MLWINFLLDPKNVVALGLTDIEVEINEFKPVGLEAIEVAVDWWAEAVKAPVFNNGTSKQGGSPMASALAMMGVQEVGSRDAALFRYALAHGVIKKIANKRIENDRMGLDVDYHPDLVLREAAEFSGVNHGNFPWKTNMELNGLRGDTPIVAVSAGYACEYVTIFPVVKIETLPPKNDWDPLDDDDYRNRGLGEDDSANFRETLSGFAGIKSVTVGGKTYAEIHDGATQEELRAFVEKNGGPPVGYTTDVDGSIVKGSVYDGEYAGGNESDGTALKTLMEVGNPDEAAN